MSTDTVITALRNHDYTVLRAPQVNDPGVVKRIDAVMPQLDEQARILAVEYLAKYNDPDTASILLKMTGDKSVQLAAAAARNLNKLASVPPPAAVLAAIPVAEDKFVRGQLYLLAGRSVPPSSIDELRRLAKTEREPDVSADALAALAKLRGQPERAAFLGQVRAAGPDQAIRIQEHLLYIGDRTLAKGLLPWFDSTADVMRIGSDRQGGMARMQDMAVWCAFQLGIRFQLTPNYLANYSPQVIGAARAAVAALPD